MALIDFTLSNAISTTDDYGAVRLWAQHYNTTAALQEQFFKFDILWAGFSAI